VSKKPAVDSELLSSSSA